MNIDYHHSSLHFNQIHLFSLLIDNYQTDSIGDISFGSFLFSFGDGCFGHFMQNFCTIYFINYSKYYDAS